MQKTDSICLTVIIKKKKVGGSILAKNLSLILSKSYVLAQVQRKGLLFRQQKVFVGENIFFWMVKNVFHL